MDVDEKQPVAWDAVVLTCSNKEWTQTLQHELDIHHKKGYLGKDVIHLVVEDPKSNVGSGGATLNALVTVVEYMSARRGFTVINGDVLKNAKILILHTGRRYTYEACSRPFVTLPAVRSRPEFDGLIYNFDLIYSIITHKIGVFSGAGVWVCSTDMVLSLPSFLDCESAFTNCDVCALSIPMPPKIVKEHGVYQLDPQGYIENIIYQPDLSTLEGCTRPDGTVPATVGAVFLSEAVAETLLSFYTKPPLDACTYVGLDSGQPQLKLSLFFDVLLPMTSAVTEEDFVRGNRSGPYGKPGTADPTNTRLNTEYARQTLWKELHGYRMKACVVEGGKFHYLTHTATEHKKLLLNFPETDQLGFIWTKQAHVDIEPTCSVSEESVIINSRLAGEVSVGGRTVISHSDLSGQITVGKDSLLTGLQIDIPKGKGVQLPDGIVLQGFNVHLKTMGMSRHMITVHGRFDDIKGPTWKSMSTFCNQPWLVLLDRTGITREELWESNMADDLQTILTAKLFPVFHISELVGLKEILWLMGTVHDDKDRTILKRWRESWRISLSDILSHTDVETEFAWKRKLFFTVGEQHLKKTLQCQGHLGFCSLYNSASVEGYTGAIFSVLDKVAGETTSPGIAARTLANIADMLGGMAGTQGGLRSGPAGNMAWKKAFSYLEAGNFAQGVAAMAKEREKWMGRPDLLIRAARHYEGAAQILIRQAVMTAKKFFSTTDAALPLMNKWIQADCPARIDISGGWSDTPPITYEHGGVVTMVGLLVNGKRPIGARARRIREPMFKLTVLDEHAADINVECHHLADLEDYCQPHAPGSLLKAAIVCVDLVDIHSSTPLSQQLMDTYGSGFEIQSWSNLPHGSGMGTSSILAGAVLAAVLSAAGKGFDTKGLVHAVLYLEQLLTTGGGWQDQIGGLIGGIRLGLSEAKLPLQVDVVDLQVRREYVEKFTDHLVLIYTGKTRLARNLLQDVVRNWYARNPFIVQTEDSLVVLAQECAHGVMDGDLEKVGSCVRRYWEMKKLLAPGCESTTIACIMSVLKPYMYGMCSAGAGGGGFIYGIMKEPRCHSFIKEILAQQEGLEAVVYDACVDENGLTITLEE
ncbi:L-fucose kinase-like [Physella acuta]|uniref:L-fucose kinase-like n=1 Tax=Physella acuta TaxID=109671 RepID=UPI0027DB7A79|nr:L-fucose kinase-like [Physella acuta]XP_059142126.1 L-fucose kinase-like [Physella acuta]XP_059142127.1 L-fucose kinase-like [Physella acuta]XP_059142128.1 L-fucose kinase-like [Physella acuta]